MTHTQYASVDAKFAALATPEGEHVVWAGPVNGAGLPILSLNRAHYLPTRIAFERHYGRVPVGQVRPSCGQPHCLHGEHLDDQVLRAEHRKALALVLGISERAALRWRPAA
jgi:hypothetical protein